MNLDEHDWTTLPGAYGVVDFPALWQALNGDDPEHRDNALDTIASNVVHQGTVYPLTGAVFPFLVEALFRLEVGEGELGELVEHVASCIGPEAEPSETLKAVLTDLSEDTAATVRGRFAQRGRVYEQVVGSIDRHRQSIIAGALDAGHPIRRAACFQLSTLLPVGASADVARMNERLRVDPDVGARIAALGLPGEPAWGFDDPELEVVAMTACLLPADPRSEGALLDAVFEIADRHAAAVRERNWQLLWKHVQPGMIAASWAEVPRSLSALDRLCAAPEKCDADLQNMLLHVASCHPEDGGALERVLDCLVAAFEELGDLSGWAESVLKEHDRLPQELEW